MRVVPEILGRQEMADAKIYGFPSRLLYGIIFESEDEAIRVKELLEKLVLLDNEGKLNAESATKSV